MAQYELCCEIFNSCSNNQMRDVDFREVEVADTDAFIRSTEPKALVEKETFSDGTVIYRTDTAGLRKRYSFTPL